MRKVAVRLRLLVLAGVLCSVHPITADDRPLPDRDAFLQEARRRLQTDYSLQRSYVYVETRRELKIDAQGRTSDEQVKVIESYPGLPGEERRWERVISVDGKPVPASELAERDRERRRKAEALASRAASQSERERASEAREQEERRREFDETVGDIFRVFDVRMVQREAIHGHDTILFSLTPRADAQPRTREGRMMRRFAVRTWMSESDHEIVRLEAEAIDTLSFGFGILARVHKGSRFSFERQKINGEAWLPARATYTGSARVGLVKTLRRGGISEFSAYRKFAVETSSSFVPPSEP